MTRAAYAHLYKTKKWQRLRREQLDRHPMCQCPHCQERGLPANVVDHIEPHKGDKKLFFDKANLRSLAKSCHDSRKQSEERGGSGFLKGGDVTGQPIDPSHPWNQ